MDSPYARVLDYGEVTADERRAVQEADKRIQTLWKVRAIQAGFDSAGMKMSGRAFRNWRRENPSPLNLESDWVADSDTMQQHVDKRSMPALYGKLWKRLKLSHSKPASVPEGENRVVKTITIEVDSLGSVHFPKWEPDAWGALRRAKVHTRGQFEVAVTTIVSKEIPHPFVFWDVRVKGLTIRLSDCYDFNFGDSFVVITSTELNDLKSNPAKARFPIFVGPVHWPVTQIQAPQRSMKPQEPVKSMPDEFPQSRFSNPCK